ncbi:Rpn family recombination-promoting nuclease/putative transposase, partial [Arsenophonus endosymbiont of Bemisia tabaci]|uniref:Rpn family recombination-promoting nuclease/putative transposase n=1 Tax=Arsenophonus endosymbiont of Bemisia tabaci TaxID=536059 RepID=UPI001EE1BC23
MKALCDLESLKVESDSFIDSEMKNYQSDILYSVKTEKGKGYFYLLIEAQSLPDKLIAWRLNFDDIIYMSYSIDFRRKVIFTMEEEGLSIRETLKQFRISSASVSLWINQ